VVARDLKPADALRGLPGHPIHPALNDVVIGSYSFAVVAALTDVLEISDSAATHGWWLAMIVGLLFTIPTALTGFLDWLTIEIRTPLWRTATAHMIVMLVAAAVFLAAVVAGKESFDEGNVKAGAFVLTLVAYGILAVGGWLGGSVVFVHGMRVLNLVSEPSRRAVAPIRTPEKEDAEGA
jgi:uncharacterized membrane protein